MQDENEDGKITRYSLKVREGLWENTVYEEESDVQDIKSRTVGR